jgi:hypothetical protein
VRVAACGRKLYSNLTLIRTMFELMHIHLHSQFFFCVGNSSYGNTRFEYSNMSAVQDLCVGKFQSLRDYFTGLTLRDLDSFEDGDVLATVNQSHRLLAKLFLREARQRVEAEGVVWNSAKHVLDAHSKVCSSAMSDSWAPANRIPILHLPSIVPCIVGDCKDVQVLDLSGNELLTDDLPHIVKLVELFPNLKQLDLSFNRMMFSGDIAAFKPLKALLGKPIVVHVLQNYFASLEGKEIFESLSDGELQNLLCSNIV